MTFALDATPLTMTSGGLPRYVSELAPHLAREFPSERFALTSDQVFPFEGTALSGLGNLTRLPGPQTWLERRWWLWGAERSCATAGAALFHGANFAIPYFSRRPTVLSIHDLSPWMDPNWQQDAGRARRHTPRMARRATMVLTLTEAVRRQVTEHFHLPADRVAAVPLAAPDNFRPAAKPTAAPYFLFTGTLEPRKNIPALLEAWRALRDGGAAIELILAGRRRADFPALAEEPGLRILGEVRETELPGLYSNALALVYPSHYEGFGLPIVEAMQCGTCVIASRDPAISEVAGEAALYGTNPREIAAAMRAIFDNGALRADYRERSLRRAAQFSWTRTARQTYAVYQEAIARFGRS